METASVIFDALSRLEITQITVEDPKIHQFVSGVRQLQWESDLNHSDDIAGLSLFRYWYSNCPLPTNSGMYLNHPMARKIVDEFANLDKGYILKTDAVSDSLQSLASLWNDRNQTLIDQVFKVVKDHPRDKVGVLVRQRNWVDPIQDFIDEITQTRVTVVAPTDLTKDLTFDLLIAVGNHNQYPDSVFSAPRAPKIAVLSFPWHGQMRTIQPSLLGSDFDPIAPRVKITGVQGSNVLQSTPYLPDPEIPFLEARLQSTYERRDDGLETQPGILARLYGDNSVFLDASSEPKNQVIDPELDEMLVWAKSSEIRPGMYVLLRSDRSGDYVADAADALLGELAPTLRLALRTWKAQLRIVVNSIGIKAVAQNLHALGLKHATEINVRNWCSTKTIATREQSDFQIIMDYLGLEEKSDEYWQAARRIKAAHLLAGRQISRQLSQLIKQHNPEEIGLMGRIDFDHPIFGDARLSAFQIETISKESTLVSIYDILTLIEPGRG